MKHPLRPARRQFLRRTAHFAVAGALFPLATPTQASLGNARSLAFDHTHTGERLSLVYAQADQYIPNALLSLNYFLRDHYSGEVGSMEPRLFDLLFRVRQELGCEAPFQVISAYRCPETNARLRRTGGGGVARRSLHMDGLAIDVRISGVPLADLRDAARSLALGGVGFYPQEQFVHLDVGRVRSW